MRCARSFGGADRGAAGALTPFQAFMTALAATIGTGNIAGVAAASCPAALARCSGSGCYGFFATAIKFGEAVLGVTFRETRAAVTAAVRSDVLPARRASLAGAGHGPTRVVAGVAALTTTPFTQTNSIALVMNTQVGVPFGCPASSSPF